MTFNNQRPQSAGASLSPLELFGLSQTQQFPSMGNAGASLSGFESEALSMILPLLLQQKLRTRNNAGAALSQQELQALQGQFPNDARNFAANQGVGLTPQELQFLQGQ